MTVRSSADADRRVEPAALTPGPKTIIDRPRVMRRLLEAAAFPIILIVAPAGFGKTTAIRQLLTSCDNSVLITIPPAATTIGRFIHAFARGCSTLFPAMLSVPNEFSVQVANSEQLLELYSAWAIANLRDAECTIAVDDLQHTDGDVNVADFLMRLVGACGDRIQWILSSRTNGTFPRTAWQAYGHADAAITASDLRMTHDEAYELATILGSPVEREQLSAWVEQTRGFPVPLAYAIRASARWGNVDAVTDGMRSLTFRFLAEHLWQSLGFDDRFLLELAALIPPSHLHDYERSGIDGAPLRISTLCDDIAFLTISASGVFLVHDLFREFVRQQISLLDIRPYQKLVQYAVTLLFNSGRFVDALEILVEVGDLDALVTAIERTPMPLDNIEITPRLISITGGTVPEKLPLGTLVLHTNHWARYGSASKALYCAEEILRRAHATSTQLLCAVRAISRFTHYLPIDNQRVWLDSMPGIIERLERRDQTQALAFQANYYSRYPELHSEAKRILQIVMRNVHSLDSRSLLDIQIVTASTFLSLDDSSSAVNISREAVALARTLNDPIEIARASNTLGMILYGECDAEFAIISETSRSFVAKAGAWRFSQASHWLPSEYYARLGDSKGALAASSLHNEVIITDETQMRRFNYFRRVSVMICNLIDEKYDAIISDFVKTGFPDSVDGPYHIAVGVAFANAFLGNESHATEHLARARALREGASSLWEQRGVFDIFSGELVALCLIGRWTQAKRLAKAYDLTGSIATLHRALVLLTDGPPFAGVLEALEPCVGKPYMGLIAILVTRTVDKWSKCEVELPLTAAEMDVLRLMGLGKSNKEIASARARSTETVKLQVASLYRKLGVENRTSAVAIGRERGLL